MGDDDWRTRRPQQTLEQKVDNLIKQEGEGSLGDILDPQIRVRKRTF